MAANRLTHPINLIGKTVDLLSLEERHFEPLYETAKDKRIWEYFPFEGSEKTRFISHYTGTLADREKGNHYPFIIFHKQENKIIGATSLYDIHPKDINLECKLLLLTYCFESLKTVRIQFRTNNLNLRSQKAIQKIGATFEGILRKNKIREDGTIRSSVYYSIIDEEWEKVKQNLLSQINRKRELK